MLTSIPLPTNHRTNVKPAMNVAEISERMTRAINDDNIKVGGGAITCTVCRGPRHAHYATPMSVPIARSATFTLGGIQVVN